MKTSQVNCFNNDGMLLKKHFTHDMSQGFHTLWITLLMMAIVVLTPLFSPAQQNTVKIGVLAHLGPEKCLQQWSPTAEYLSKKVPPNRFEIVPLTLSEIPLAVREGRIDLLLTNPTSYIDVEQQYNSTRIASIRNRYKDEVYSFFGSVIFTRSDNQEIFSLSDLKGKRFMATDPEAFGGWRVALRELKKAGLNPFKDFKEMQYGGGRQDRVIYAVRDGKVDAGSVRTDMLERMADEGRIRIEDFRVLVPEWVKSEKSTYPFLRSTRLYPEWPLAKLESTSDELAWKIAIALMTIRNDDPAAKAGSYDGWTYAPSYQPVRELEMELRVGAFGEYGKVNPSEIIKRYLVQFVAGLIILFIILAALIAFVSFNRRLSETKQRLTLELSARQAAQAELDLRNQELTERMKELNCLYEIAHILEKPDISWTQVFQEISGFIPVAMKHPEVAGSRINIDDEDYKSGNFRNTQWKYSSMITFRGIRIGAVEVCYLEKRPESDEGPFSKEERNLVDAVAERLGKIVFRKEAEKEREKLIRELQKSNKELDDFSYIASHDLREPLRGIINYSTFLMEDYGDKLDADGKSKIETLIRLSNHQEKLIQSLLEYSRVGRVELAMEDVDLNTVIEHIVESVKASFQGTDIDIITEPLPIIYCDRVRINTLFSNLITNALKYNDKEKKIIEVGCIKPSFSSDAPVPGPFPTGFEGSSRRIFYVKDNGIGIREQHIEKIFTIFKRLHAKDKYGGGTGIGLTIVKKIVELHHGIIRVESVFAQGTTFYFTLQGEAQ